MATAYPGALDSFTNPTTGNKLNNPSHSLQHTNVNGAVIAAETKLGTGASTPISGTVLRATGTGTSAWGAVVAGDIASNAVTTAKISDGSVTFAKMAAFDKIRLEQQADVNLTNNANTAITFGSSSELYKIGSITHSTSASTSKVTIGTTGYYNITGCVRFANGNTTQRYETQIQVNNVIVAANAVPATATSVYVSVATVINLTVGDFVELYAFQQTGGTIVAQAVTRVTSFTLSLIA